MSTHEPEQPEQPDAQRAVDAVRAADPAAQSTPDLARLRAALSASTGVPLGTGSPEAGSPEAGAAGAEVVDELAVRRARRTPRWIQAAAAVAGVALVGGVGYAVGTQRTAAPQAASDVPAAISLERQGGSAGDAANESAKSPSFAGGQAMSSARDKRAASFFYGGHTVFTAKGLSSATGSQDAWAYDAASVYSAETAARLADALGVKGKPHEDWGWTVGPNDGTAATVSLSPDGTASMSYYDPAKDPWAGCVDKSAPDAPAADSGTGDSGTAGMGIGETCATGQAPKDATAKAEAKDVLASLGVDTGSLVLEVQEDGTDLSTTVVAYPVVSGQRTDLPWSVTVVKEGVSSVNGPVAPLVALGSYDVVSPTQAVERLNDPRFGAAGGAIPYAAMREGAATDVASAPSQQPTVPPTIEPGSPIGWPVTDVTITKARLGLANHTEQNGSTALVPSYELTGSDGSVWSVIAVVDDQLDLASR